jgi:hypothetical protein
VAQVVECLEAHSSSPIVGKRKAGHRWLMPLILATWEAEDGLRPAQSNSLREPHLQNS